MLAVKVVCTAMTASLTPPERALVCQSSSTLSLRHLFAQRKLAQIAISISAIRLQKRLDTASDPQRSSNSFVWQSQRQLLQPAFLHAYICSRQCGRLPHIGASPLTAAQREAAGVNARTPADTRDAARYSIRRLRARHGGYDSCICGQNLGQEVSIRGAQPRRFQDFQQTLFTCSASSDREARANAQRSLFYFRSVAGAEGSC